jgi:hypothetical protein
MKDIHVNTIIGSTVAIAVFLLVIVGVMAVNKEENPRFEKNRYYAVKTDGPQAGSPEFCRMWPDDKSCPKRVLTAAEQRQQDRQRAKDYAEALRLEKQSMAERRQAFATEAQHRWWVSGSNAKVEARGTTLYLEYPLADRAEAYQLRKLFIEPKFQGLREMGFKRVVLSDGGYEHEFAWDLH